MARLIVWLVLAIIIARLLWRFVRAILDGAGVLRGDASPAAVKLVRDPVCGIFVAPAQALTAGSGAETRYFCSEKCRKQWSGR
jgi:YHS domain-containing protein